MDKFFKQGYKFVRFEKDDKLIQIKIIYTTKKITHNILSYKLQLTTSQTKTITDQ